MAICSWCGGADDEHEEPCDPPRDLTSKSQVTKSSHPANGAENADKKPDFNINENNY